MFTFIIVTISLLLIFKIASSFFSKEVGILTIFLFFIFPIHCYYSLGILAEVPAFFSLSLALYGWSIIFHNPNKKTAWLLFVFGLWFLILNRPNSILILGLGFLIIGYSYFKQKEFYSKYGKKLALTFTIVGMLSYGGLQLSKKITGSNSNHDSNELFYFVAHLGRFQFREEPTDFRFWDDENRADSKDYQNWCQSRIDLDLVMYKTNRNFITVYKEFLINDALEHPFLFTRQFFVKCFYGHVYFINNVQPKDFHIGPIRGKIVYWFFMLLINCVNLVVLFGAFIFLFKEKNLIKYWLFLGVIFALLLFHGLTYMEPRYMFPSRVALYIISAAGLYRIKWIRNKVNFVAKFVFPNKIQTNY